MAVQIGCDNPACEKSHELEPGQPTDFVPAGWWEVARAAEIGGHEASYVFCTIACVREGASMFTDEPVRPDEPAVDD